ncbi:hypothetical protein [Nocardia beijingensis]
MDQMIDGRIVATDANGTIMATIEAFDSSEYEIAINPASGHPAAATH